MYIVVRLVQRKARHFSTKNFSAAKNASFERGATIAGCYSEYEIRGAEVSNNKRSCCTLVQHFIKRVRKQNKRSKKEIL